MRAVWTEREITPKMMKRTEWVIHFVVVKERELVMNLSASWTVIECRFVEIDRELKVSLGSFPIRILNELRIPRTHEAIAASKSATNKDQYPDTNQTHFF